MIQLNPSLFAAYKDRPMSDSLVDWFLVFVIWAIPHLSHSSDRRRLVRLPLRLRRVAMLLKERIESFLLANSKLARLDARVVHTQEGVHVIHRLCTDIGKLLNFGSSILNLQSIKTMSTIKRGYRLIVIKPHRR